MKEIFFCNEMKDILKIAKRKILILDGAMGTMIQRHNLNEDDFRKIGLKTIKVLLREIMIY